MMHRWNQASPGASPGASPWLEDAIEILPDRLYLCVMNMDTKKEPKSSRNTHFFCVDDQISYQSFKWDFGPVNLGQVYRYDDLVQAKLRSPHLAQKKLVHFTVTDYHKLANAVFLVSSFAVIRLQRSPADVMQMLKGALTRLDELAFGDVSCPQGSYQIQMGHCIQALYQAQVANFFSWKDFDDHDYHYYEQVQNGDLNWLVPQKLLAFCGPHDRAQTGHSGIHYLRPDHYFHYFRMNRVSTVVRLNCKMYQAQRFIQAGFQHYDLFFEDGTTPPDSIVRSFLAICEQAPGAVAVHCKAGLGRTGTLIGCYIMKHWDWDALTTIAWLRICRPGSVIGQQQDWLLQKEKRLRKMGRLLRHRHPQPDVPGPGVACSFPIYSKVLKHKLIAQMGESVSELSQQFDVLSVSRELQPDDHGQRRERSSHMSQGDQLRLIKSRHHLT